ncbi:MAG: ABC transporter ATP-binding protein [Treponemataceae bacterium]|nr:MAG: ABC transporter ATP-binding protein [Treponemataceae bacterium]
MTNDDCILKIEKLTKTFSGISADDITLIRDLDFAVAKGESIVITGESGSGKSTLLNMIAGLEDVTSGKIIVDGQEISKMNETESAKYRSKYLGLIFQFHYLLQDFTALENVYMPAFMTGTNKKIAIERARALLRDAGLEPRMNHLPAQLSGGERQRCAVARSLINDPEFILADEPTGNLDPANSATTGDMLFSLAKTYKKTLILVTHDRELSQKGSSCYRIQNAALVKLGQKEK